MDGDQFDRFLAAFNRGQTALTDAITNAIGPNAPHRGLAVKLQPFTSIDPDSWIAWRKHFELEAQSRQWNDEVGKRQLLGAMQGDAFHYVSNIDPNEAGLTVQGMLNRYQAIFLPQNDPDVAREKFDVAHRREGEDILHWHARIQALFRRGFPNRDAENDEMVRDKFRKGINHIELGHQLKLANPQTMTDALQVARVHDVAIKERQAAEAAMSFKRETGTYSISSISHDDDVINAAIALLTKAKIRENQGSPAVPTIQNKFKKSTSNSRCFVCNRFGHWKNECTLRRRFPSRSNSINRRRTRSTSPNPGFQTRQFRRTGKRQGRRRLMFRHPRGFFRPLRRRPGRKGRWKSVRVPRRRQFRRFPRNQAFKSSAIYALDDDDQVSDDEIEELCIDEITSDTEMDEFYYLDMDDEEEGFIEAINDVDEGPESDEYVTVEMTARQEN